MPGALPSAAKLITEQFTSAGWKYDHQFSIVTDEVGSLEFKQGPASLSVTLLNLPLVGATPDGTSVKILTRGVSFGPAATDPNEASAR